MTNSSPQSYVALARKYRPLTFADLVGQEHVVRTLSNAMAQNRVHHAFLFTGARGVGKTTTARILARSLNCEQGPSITPCMVCAACKDTVLGVDPDVIEIDGASNTGVDSVRELRDSVRYLPNRGRFKLYIIDEVHMLSTAAFNALLKTLEEPPPHVKFIFATTEPHKIPITILSRCQRFDFRRVMHRDLTAHLRMILQHEGYTLGASALAAVVRQADGSVRDALSLLDQVLSYAGTDPADEAVLQALGAVDRTALFAVLDAVLRRDAQAALSTVAELEGRGLDLAEVAALFVEHVRDVMVAKTVAAPSEQLLDRSAQEIEALKVQGEATSTADLQRIFARAAAVAEDVSRSSLVRVTLEMGFLSLMEIEPVVSINALLTRLDGLLSGAPVVASAVVRPAAAPAPPPVAAAALPSAPRPVLPSASQDWRQFVEHVKATKPALSSVLEHARVLQFGASGVEIGYAANTFYWEAANDAENKASVIAALAEQFAQPVKLTITAVTASDGASLAETRVQAERAHEIKIHKDALVNPAVQSVVKILGGEVREIRAVPFKE